MDESLTELKAIFERVRGWENDPSQPAAILVGGWAVYSYNPYQGSVDIDLVMRGGRKKRLVTELKASCGYHYYKDEMEDRRLFKRGKTGTILVDFLSPTFRYRFEGRDESLALGSLLEELEYRPIGGLRPPVPTRSALLVMKLKAAWDRKWRLDHGTSTEPAFEEGKLVKDRADVLALIDPGKGRSEIDIDSLGGMIDRFPFLTEVLEGAGQESGAAERYGCTPDAALSMVRNLHSLL